MKTALDNWPALALEDWRDTCATLHLWTQIVGKTRLRCMPWINHSWHVPLYVSARGLTTGLMHHNARGFAIDFDFVEHQLCVTVSDGSRRVIPLRPMSVAAFYRELFTVLRELGFAITIHGRPNELEEAIPFAEDHVHAAYDAEYAQRFWRVLVQVERVFQAFRAGFVGKSSPVQFYWGSFDLALSRFSGRRAPLHPGGVPHLPDRVVQEAYSHEVSSCGLWPGGGAHPYPLFYSYIYPEPEGFPTANIKPADASYSDTLREFILPYDAIRQAASPDAPLSDFLQSTYEAAARLAGWDRAALERQGEEARPLMQA